SYFCFIIIHNMKNLALPLTFLFMTSLIGCSEFTDLLDDSPCGPSTDFGLSLFTSKEVFTNGLYRDYMEGNNRVFQWSYHLDNVCTDEHVNTTYRVGLTDANSIQSVSA